jgi:hypothetical protein
MLQVIISITSRNRRLLCAPSFGSPSLRLAVLGSGQKVRGQTSKFPDSGKAVAESRTVEVALGLRTGQAHASLVHGQQPAEAIRLGTEGTPARDFTRPAHAESPPRGPFACSVPSRCPPE